LTSLRLAEWLRGSSPARRSCARSRSSSAASPWTAYLPSLPASCPSCPPRMLRASRSWAQLSFSLRSRWPARSWPRPKQASGRRAATEAWLIRRQPGMWTFYSTLSLLKLGSRSNRTIARVCSNYRFLRSRLIFMTLSCASHWRCIRISLEPSQVHPSALSTRIYRHSFESRIDIDIRLTIAAMRWAIYTGRVPLIRRFLSIPPIGGISKDEP
jgi:hypothetical protein